MVRTFTLAAGLAACLLAPAAQAATTTYFTEDFSDNSAGWTLGSEWQIGQAMSSSGQNAQGPDPALDHSASDDNGIAGAVIGGNVTTALHDFYWLVSPVINLAAAASAELEFWRWLNSDYTPYMQNRVDVFDGTDWQTIFQTEGPPGVADSDWVQQVFDVSSHTNAAFQMRFGYNVDSSGVWTVSGWNIDDVTLRAIPDTATVPVPAALPLLALGLGGLFALRRRRG
jgi:hypothetical protein